VHYTTSYKSYINKTTSLISNVGLNIVMVLNFGGSHDPWLGLMLLQLRWPLQPQSQPIKF